MTRRFIGRSAATAMLALTLFLGCDPGSTGPVWVDGLRVQPDSLFLIPGEVGELTAVPFDQNDNPLPDRSGRVEWLINSSVASLEAPGDGSARITALRAGATNVSAVLGRGSKRGLIYVEPEELASIHIEPSTIELGISSGFGSGATVRAVLINLAGDTVPPGGYRISWRVSNRNAVHLGTGQEVLTGVSTSVRGRQPGSSTITLQVGDRQSVGNITVR